MRSEHPRGGHRETVRTHTHVPVAVAYSIVTLFESGGRTGHTAYVCGGKVMGGEDDRGTSTLTPPAKFTLRRRPVCAVMFTNSCTVLRKRKAETPSLRADHRSEEMSVGPDGCGAAKHKPTHCEHVTVNTRACAKQETQVNTHVWL